MKMLHSPAARLGSQLRQEPPVTQAPPLTEQRLRCTQASRVNQEFTGFKFTRRCFP
jgi:hypothetical protein